MIFSIRMTIRELVAPDHRISCPRKLWRRVTEELFRRGNQAHESGAFLLGTERKGRLQVSNVVFYDELDPDAYDSGVCVLHAEAFAKLWKVCRERQLTVVADAHTHPGAAVQSHSDRTNPMVARTGHVAMIVPNFAKATGTVADLGVYQYCGDHQWTDHSGPAAQHFFYVGFWS